MKNTRRTFLQSLAAVPLLGWAFASAKPAMPSLPPVKVDMGEPVYEFDEPVMLSDLSYGTVIAGEGLRRGDLVVFSKSVLCKKTPQVAYFQVVKATIDQHPVGVVLQQLTVGDEAQDAVLVRGELNHHGTVIYKPASFVATEVE